MSDRLQLPDAWAEERCRAMAPDLFEPSAAERTAVDLSHPQVARWMSQFDVADVRSDLERGFVVERHGGVTDPFYRLIGGRYTVFAQPRTAENSGVPMAAVTSVKLTNGPPRTLTVVPRSVRFWRFRDEAPADLDELATAFEQGRDKARARQAVLKRARAGLAVTTEPDRPYTDLHAKVRRRYRPLRLLLELLEQRSELEGTIRVDGVTVGSGITEAGVVLWIRLPRPAGIVEGRIVMLAADGWRAGNLRVHAVDENGALVAVSMPADRRVDPGLTVRLEQRGRFALGKHSTALAQFLDGNVEGDWTHLAQLLTEPHALPVVPFTEVSRYFDPRLNTEQRAAVRGAVGTPHAFHIQGPPGTGKTTVITEVVQQLLARGERVLLLAPMHVAVDEVLGRIADQPGVLALRISWDEGRVAPELRRYLPEQAGRTYLSQARRPETSQAMHWRTEIAGLTEQQQVVRRQLDAAHRHRDATAVLAAAKRERRQFRERLTAAVVEADVELGAADHALRQIGELIPGATARAAALRAQLDAVPALQRYWAQIVDAFGSTSAVAQLTAQTHAAELYRHRLLTDGNAWMRRRGGANARLAELHLARSRGESGHQASVAAAQDRLAAAAATLAAAQERVRELSGRAADNDELRRWQEQLTREIVRREQRIILEQRWFELSGLSDGDTEALLSQVDVDLRNSANLICCTTTGINRDLGDADFDTLIVDEASRVVDSEFLIGARRARRWVLVGDDRQLPPYVEAADENHLHALSALSLNGRATPGTAAPSLDEAVTRLAALWVEEEELHQFRADTVQRTAERLLTDGTWQQVYRGAYDTAWKHLSATVAEPERELLRAMLDHLVRSLFERTVDTVPAGLRQALREQRRMIRPIAELVRQPVYGGGYTTPDPCEIVPLRYGGTSTPVVFIDTSADGGMAKERLVGNGFVNDLETRIVADMCRSWERRLRESGGERTTVSILTFYRAHANAIRAALGGPNAPEFKVLDFKVIDAIDKIQGQESDLVFLSFGRAYLGGGTPSSRYGRWLQDVRRLNVACTRARRCLVLIGHAPTLRRLNGVPAAEAFYKNLFHLLDEHPDYSTVRQAK